MKKCIFYVCSMVVLFLILNSYIVYGDDIQEISYSDIIIDCGYDNSYNPVYSVMLDEFINTTPSNLSLSELNLSIADTTVASLTTNYDGDIIVIGENVGHTYMEVSNDYVREVIDIYVVYPRSGGELDYEPSLWIPSEIRLKRHCYFYALNLYDDLPESLTTGFDYYFHDPGEISNLMGYSSRNIVELDENFEYYIENVRYDMRSFVPEYRNDVSLFKCVDLANGINSSVAGAENLNDPNNFYIASSAGTYKVVLVMDFFGNMHWYRQDSNGLWSHKNGNGYVTNLDSEGKVIVDPRTCAKTYTEGTYVYVGCFECKPLQWRE